MNTSFKLNVLAFAVALTTGSWSFAAHADSALAQQSRIQEAAFKTVLTFNQHFAEDGTMAITAKSGPLTKSNSGYGVERNVQDLTVQTFSGFSRVLTPHLGAASVLTQADALGKAKNWVKFNVPSTALRMSNEIRNVGASAGIMTFNEEVYISRRDLEPIKKVLSFVMTVDREGKATYGDPVLTTPEPDIVYATYTPLRPGDDFNESWVLPHAGFISYQVLDYRGNVKLNTRHIDVQGAYDAPTGSGGAECFIQKSTAGCSIRADVPDVRELMLKHGADLSIVDFTTQIVPVYDLMDDDTYVPRGALAYNDRNWNCVEYKNVGEYGFVLEVQLERWFAKMDTQTNLDMQFNSHTAGTMLSPVDTFEKTVLASSLPGHPDYYVISPLEGDNTLFRIGDPALKGVTHIAPVRGAANTDELLKANVVGHFPLNKESGGEGWSIFTYGVVGDNYWRTGNYSGSIDFNLKSIHDFQEFSLLTQNFDDWLLITINGVPVFSGPYDGITSLRPINSSHISENNRCLVGEDGRWHCGFAEFIVRTYETPAQGWQKHISYSESPFAGATLSSYACSSPEHVEEVGTFRRCVANPFTSFAFCTTTDSGGDAQNFTGWSCSDSKVCRPGFTVEYVIGGVTRCGHHEHGENWNRSYERSILPYLKKGENSLKALLLVGGKGEMYVRFRVHGCGTELGLPFHGVPPIPLEGTPGALLDKLADQNSRPGREADD